MSEIVVVLGTIGVDEPSSWGGGLLSAVVVVGVLYSEAFAVWKLGPPVELGDVERCMWVMASRGVILLANAS